MGKALYRKYRSKKLSEIVGQKHITDTLTNALKKGQISHAYLLTGPRGVGKTSVARILAYEVNGLAYEDDHLPIDIIEIDAASNRRIEEIRDLREKVHIAPVNAKYKVYIIDEVHMLTKEAFNALLKTLEEPPDHVIFILATTEAHKLPETIISRTQRFTFKPIEPALAREHLKQIASQEGITISDEALKVLVEHGEGSFRDSISLLDQIRTTNSKIELDDVYQLFGIAPALVVAQLLSLTFEGSPQKLIESLEETINQGISPAKLAKQLGELIRDQLINNQLAIPAAEATRLLEELLSVTGSTGTRLLEIVLLNAQLRLQPSGFMTQNPAPPIPPSPKEEVKVIKQAKNPDIPLPPKSDQSFDKTWQQALDNVKKQHNTLYSILRMAKPQLDGQKLTLTFSFPFHQKQLNEAKNKQLISEIVSQHIGKPISIENLVQQSVKPQPPVENLDNINSIFGGAEVLDS